MKIILVDDYEPPRLEAAIALQQIYTQPEILQFDNAESTLNGFKRDTSIDLVVTDILMPGMNGIELAKAILSERETSILFHTGSWNKEVLMQILETGLIKKTPIEIVMKRYFFKTDESYINDFRQSLASLRAKGKVTLDLSIFDEINKEISRTGVNGLYNYTISIFKELVRDLTDIAQVLLNLPQWDFSQQSTANFLHSARYPITALQTQLRGYGPEELHEVRKIVDKMDRIRLLIDSKLERYNASTPNALSHRASLASATKLEFPKQEYPVKLRNRQIMLEGTGVTPVIINPGESYQTYLEKVNELLNVTGQVLARSCHVCEDASLPLAGQFNSSKPISTISALPGAIETVRAIQSESLENLCLYRRLDIPRPEGMFVLIEPYYETQYVGSVLQHPNNPDQILIEFAERANMKEKSFILYDVQRTEVIGNPVVPTNLDPCGFAKLVAGSFKENMGKIARTVHVGKDAYQIEFGAEKDKVYGLQLRIFCERHRTKDFEIKDSYECQAVFGVTDGVDLVVTSTDEPELLSLLSKRAKEDKLGICYILKDGCDPNIPSYIDNLGLLIVGKGLAVQGHRYFNAMSQADNVLLLDQGQFGNVQLEPGDVLRYVSNGISGSITKIDTSEKIKYEIRALLN